MLGRTANGILWMFRYLERAENTARLLEAGSRMAMLRGNRGAKDEWRSVLTTCEQEEGYLEHHSEFTGPLVTNYILRGANNPASVLCMIENARTNARSVRTAITREVWEATNESWMVLHELFSRQIKQENLGAVLGQIRRQTMLVRGAMQGTMLRNDIFNFARIGIHLERADNTARILDVKYHLLLPSVAWVGSQLDNTQWELILRCVAGERVYPWLNGGRLEPRGIAEFLILDERFPRSLLYSYGRMASGMAGLAREYGAKTSAHGLLDESVEQMKAVTIGEIFDNGLHEFITTFIDNNIALADAIASDYRFLE